ncbi:alkaline phosphatase family protein [Streptomyces sp. NPDC012510]|uniref:alkaline phosphatase family protein n=1 Tax=Streptomyces sp. NPDC012510 TaxID=3364838 RepID=UPI0036E05111
MTLPDSARPVYDTDGSKEPDSYTWPPSLHDELTDRLGTFPLLTYWGPNAGMPSTQWILGAARQVFDEHDPDLTLVYVPQLDYEPQRSGPDSPATTRAARQLDDALRPLLDHFLSAAIVETGAVRPAGGRDPGCGRAAAGAAPRHTGPRSGAPTEAFHRPARVNVTCVTPPGEETASTS